MPTPPSSSGYGRDVRPRHRHAKSFEKLKPDMLIVLGDVSAKGFKITNSKWLSLLQQFQRMLGPFLGLPLHIVLGDRDIGVCTNINEKSVGHIANHLPGLDSSGCGTFEISNISFVSLNAVALLCRNNNLRFSVEKVIESESLDLRTRAKGMEEEAVSGQLSCFSDFCWRENVASAGSGPVLLLHFPLHRTTRSSCDGVVPRRNLWQIIPETHESSGQLDRRLAGAGPYELRHTLPPNDTEYILQALKPRIVFSAHTHQFCDHIHVDGTREVTVPAMSWTARDDPGFIFVTFGQNKVVTVSHCSLARESHVLLAYISIFILLIATTLVMSNSHLTNLFVP
uniref:Metallophosphoesterase 1 n=1 Tax=Anthurium amnicola TaxID=1678845 RepID=A0A1D1XDH9_9ARAE